MKQEEKRQSPVFANLGKSRDKNDVLDYLTFIGKLDCIGECLIDVVQRKTIMSIIDILSTCLSTNVSNLSACR